MTSVVAKQLARNTHEAVNHVNHAVFFKKWEVNRQHSIECYDALRVDQRAPGFWGGGAISFLYVNLFGDSG